ncbi:MAG: hypothetical protein QNL04_01450 [SAR324 cluster bacterium]|nr:hypothetical protein [SAR324 cluster bacterium]
MKRLTIALSLILAIWSLPAFALKQLSPPIGYNYSEAYKKIGKKVALPDWGVLVCEPYANEGFLKDHLLCGIQSEISHKGKRKQKEVQGWASLEYLYKNGWRLISVIPDVRGVE